MKAAVIASPKKIRIQEVPVPVPGEEEVVVKLKGSGLCVSNLPVWEGREWFTYPVEPGSPGHEGYGIVDRVGANAGGIFPGDKVSLISYHAYAEYDKIHVSNVVKVPEHLNGAPFPGEPLACAVNVFKRSDIHPGQTVVVIGAGFLGCLLIQLLKHAGVRIIAVSQRSSSLGFAEKAGASQLVRFSDVYSTAQQIRKMTGNVGAQRVIEATGEQPAIDLGTDLVSERGKLIIAGFHQGGLRTINLQTWNWKGIDVINAHERDHQVYVDGLHEAVQKVEAGILRPNDLITHFFDLKDLSQAFQTLQKRPEGFLKAVVTNS